MKDKRTVNARQPARRSGKNVNDETAGASVNVTWRAFSCRKLEGMWAKPVSKHGAQRSVASSFIEAYRKSSMHWNKEVRERIQFGRLPVAKANLFQEPALKIRFRHWLRLVWYGHTPGSGCWPYPSTYKGRHTFKIACLGDRILAEMENAYSRCATSGEV